MALLCFLFLRPPSLPTLMNRDQSCCKSTHVKYSSLDSTKWTARIIFDVANEKKKGETPMKQSIQSTKLRCFKLLVMDCSLAKLKRSANFHEI